MSIFRNKEIKHHLLIQAALSVTGTAALCFVCPLAALIGAVTAALMLICMIIFYNWRYRQLAALADYLKNVNSGNYALDMRDNDEGELSILKNEIYKVTVTLRQQNESLKEEQKQLANALSDISHQLKTPLTSLFMMTDLLCEASLPDEKRSEFTIKIRSQLDRIQWLVSSLLKLSRLDAKAVVFKRQTVPVRELVERACVPLLIPIELKNQRLSIHVPEGSLICDMNWTAEALTNILKNCIEHTPEHGEISVSAQRNPLFLKIVIEDTGNGFLQEELPHIFQRFYRGKNAGSDSVGIGLAMSKAIINAQNGSIDARNRPDREGAAFLITFS